MNLILFLVIVLLIAITYAFSRVLEARHDAREPPSLPSKIPFIGHVIGMLRRKARYYVDLRQKHGAPIYTLAMPEGSKLYVVTSSELIAAVQRHPKALAFPPVGVKFAMSLAGSSNEGKRIATHNINGEDGDYGLSMDFNKVVYPSLSPGKPLEAMYETIIPQIAVSLENLRTTSIELNRWVRHELTVAITDCVYGPGNPFKERAVEEAFWDFESDLFRIMMNLAPSISARKGIQGRQLMTDAFVRYFQSGALASSSVFARSRYLSAEEHCVPLIDIARFEVVNLIGTLTSTIRTVTWMLYHLYSTPAALADCRAEIPKVTSTSRTANGSVLHSIDITALKHHAPILGSTFQEVLRHHALGTSVRQVMHDTMLENRYLLKKNNMILMPSVSVHTDPNIWGPSVDEFDHRRFLKPAKSMINGNAFGTEKGGQQQHKSPPASAFRAFGGGTTLCPGRHFATTVTMAVTTMFIMRYDLQPIGNRGVWPRMTAHKTHAVAAVEQMDQMLEVEVREREGSEGKWAFAMEGSEAMFKTVAEDL